MKSMEDGFGYNERLFSGGFRSKLHVARFLWLRKKLQEIDCSCDRILELGCFDGKSIDFLPKKPEKFVGYDANWEGGLDIARERWKEFSNFTFHNAVSPEDISLDKSNVFDIAVCMETLEHIPPELVDGYLKKISEHLNGYFFITVPNEKGILFLAKWCVKRILSKDSERYTFQELINATLGRTKKIPRNEHKGFDYDLLIDELEKYFEVVDVSGFPFSMLPHSLCFGIGITARSKSS